MNKNNENIIDNLFKKNFEDFHQEPSQNIWENINNKLTHSNINAKKIWINKKIIISALTSIILIAGLFLIINPEQKILNNFNKNQNLNLSSSNNTKQNFNKNNNITNYSYISTNNNNSNSKLSLVNVNNIISINHSNTSTNTQNYKITINSSNKQETNLALSYNNNENQEANNSYENLNNKNTNNIIENKIISSSIEKLKYIKPKFIQAIDIPLDVTECINLKSSEYYIPKRQRGTYSIGIHVSDDFLYKTIENRKNNIHNYSFDLSLKYTITNFFIETGLGIQYYKDNISYNISYSEKHVVDSYFYVDYIDDNYKPYGHTVYIWSNENIKTLSDVNNNSYYFLQLPITCGFQKNFGKKLKYFVKGGMIYSKLIHNDNNKNSHPELTINNNEIVRTIIQTSNPEITTTKTNYNLLIGVGLAYRLSNRINIALEPNLKYYINPIYKEQKSINPYSIGIKTGIIMDL